LAALLAVLVITPGLGWAQNARTHLTTAIIAFGQGKLAVAKQSLDKAAASTSDAAILSKIHRQRGIIFEVENKGLDSVLEFLKAIYYNSELALSKREHQGRVSDLFECAKRLSQSGFKAPAIQARFANSFSSDPIECPIDSNGEMRLEYRTKLPPKNTLIEKPPPAIKAEQSWLSSPTFWIIASVSLALAGGATATGFMLAPSEGGEYGGSSATTIRLSD